MLLTRYQFELYGACRETFEGFSSEGMYKEVVASQGGEAACVIELVSTDQVHAMDFYIAQLVPYQFKLYVA